MKELSGFVISSSRTLERNASSEIYYLLSEVLELDDVKSEPIKGISGLSLVTFSEDSVTVLNQIKQELEKDPTHLQYVLKIVPIQYRVASDLDEYKKVSGMLKEKWDVELKEDD